MPRKRSSRSYFNPRSHKGSDLLTRPERRERTKFQSTLPQGERPFTTEEAAWKRLFQSTLPQGERRYQIGRMCRGIAFQSTLPQGERLNVIFLPPKAHYFNPRSHKGSDFLFASPWLQYDISIHAPTRGATFLCGCRARREIISIHAPTRGATQSQVTQLNSDLHFNPRSHKGSDVIDPARTPRAYKISIHAPTRGATTFSGNVAVPTGISIHAPTRGATASRYIKQEK